MNRREFLQTTSGAALGCSVISSVAGAAAAEVPAKETSTSVKVGQAPDPSREVDTDPVHQHAVARYSAWKFGMFIHWGQYSVAGVEASWPIMRPSAQFLITQDAYVSLYRQFNPTRFDPDAWVQLARQAGMRYMVFTTKHHDGFCMFDTSYTDYNISNSPYKKDVVAMLAEAAKKQNMPLGLYYSPPDMHHPDYRDTSKLANSNWNGEPTRSVWPIYLHYMELQLRELLTRYGEVAVVWFDGLYDQRKYDGYRMQRVIHELQPRTLINNRIGIPGDFETPEQFLPAAIPVKGSTLDFDHRNTGSKPGETPPTEDFRLWETCMTINKTWAYNPNDRNYKSARELIQHLVEVASKGGNFLLDVGPEPNGTIQPEFVERLQTIGKWLNVNGESIYGTTYGPLQSLSYGKTTAKEGSIFLHVFDWPNGNLEVDGIHAHVQQVRMLAGGGKALHFEQHNSQVTIRIPKEAPDPYVSVLEIKTA